MAKIKIEKHTRLKDGSLSGFFSVPADKVTESLRMELMRLEGVEADIRPVEVPVLLTEPLSPGDIRLAIEEHQRAISHLVVQLMDMASLIISIPPEGMNLGFDAFSADGKVGINLGPDRPQERDGWPDEVPESAGEAE